MTPSDYDFVAPSTPYIRAVHPGDSPTYDGMTQRAFHVNEGQYIARVSDFKNINHLEQQLTNLLISAYDRKWLAVIMDPVTGQINKQLPLIFSLLYTKYVEGVEADNRLRTHEVSSKPILILSCQ